MLGRGFIAAATFACALITTTTTSAQQTLEAVKARGQLVCGIGTGVAGFGLPDSKGVWQGMDVDLCRGLATAIFNDPNKVRFAPLSSSTRFTALGVPAVNYGPGDPLFAHKQDEHVPVEQIRASIAAETCLGYLPSGEELAGAAVFFASDLSRSITGQALAINAGHWLH